MEPFDRRAWMAEDNQEGGGGEVGNGPKLEQARGKKVVVKGDDEPAPQSATADDDNDSNTDPTGKAGRTGTVVAPARD